MSDDYDIAEMLNKALAQFATMQSENGALRAKAEELRAGLLAAAGKFDELTAAATAATKQSLPEWGLPWFIDTADAAAVSARALLEKEASDGDPRLFLLPEVSSG